METKYWELYNFIKKRSEIGINTTVRDICDAFPNYYRLNAKESNFSNCPTLYKDIDYLNGSSEVNKVIIKDNNNFRFGTEEEVNAYKNKVKIQALKMLKKYWNIENKTSHQGQYKLISNKGDIIDEKSKAERFVNAFLDEIRSENVVRDIEAEVELMSYQDQYQYWRKRYLDLGGYPIVLTLDEYKKEVRRLEENQSKI